MNKTCILYDANTKEILRVSVILEISIDAYIGYNQTVFPDRTLSYIYQDVQIPLSELLNNFYIEDNNLVPYSNDELTAKRNIPRGYKWKMPEKIVIDDRSLDQSKQYKWDEIKEVRENKKVAPFEYDGHQYDANQQAINTRIMGLSNGINSNTQWTTQDNQVVTLNPAQMKAMGKALSERLQTIHEISISLRSQIDNATTIQEVDNINWPAYL